MSTGRTLEEKARRLEPPDGDRSGDATWRRQVASLYREMVGLDPPAPATVEAEPERFDVLDGTPFLLVRATRVFRAREGFLASDSLGARDLVLLEVARRKETKPGHLRCRLRLPPSTVTGVIDAYVRVGWICRRRDGYDRRTWVMTVTEEGLRRAGEVAARWGEADEALLKGSSALTPGERDQLRRLLKKAGSALAARRAGS